MKCHNLQKLPVEYHGYCQIFDSFMLCEMIGFFFSYSINILIKLCKNFNRVLSIIFKHARICIFACIHFSLAFYLFNMHVTRSVIPFSVSSKSSKSFCCYIISRCVRNVMIISMRSKILKSQNFMKSEFVKS